MNMLYYPIEELTGGAWLSGIRVLKRLVKSYNECNAYSLFPVLFRYRMESVLEGRLRGPLSKDCGRKGVCQVVMPFMDWAIHMIQWE